MKPGPGWRRLRVKNQFLFVISLVLLAAFCWSVISQLLFLSRAERDVGVVREVRAHDDRCGGKRRRDCTKFHATVEFQSAGSRQSSYLSAGEARGHGQPLSKARYRIGDPVPIVFDPSRPEQIYRDKFLDIWGSPLAWLFFQIFTLGASLLRGSKEDEPVTLELNR
jgi:Protein of unknown function (DUF3592)